MDTKLLDETAKKIIALPKNTMDSQYDKEFLFDGAMEIFENDFDGTIEYFNNITRDFFIVYSDLFYILEFKKFDFKIYIDCLIKNDLRLNARCYYSIFQTINDSNVNEEYKIEIINSYLYNELIKDMKDTMRFIKWLSFEDFFNLDFLIKKLIIYFNSKEFDNFINDQKEKNIYLKNKYELNL